jgi:hypothetical protein
MFGIQPKALTDSELVRLADAWLMTNDSLPRDTALELIERLHRSSAQTGQHANQKT